MNYGTASASTTRPAFVFKITNPNGNNTDKVNFRWVGQSTTAALPIAVEAYKYGTAGTSATGWITVTTIRLNSWQENTDVTATATIFSNFMSDFYDPDNANTMAFRVMQANVATSSPAYTFPSDCTSMSALCAGITLENSK